MLTLLLLKNWNILLFLKILFFRFLEMGQTAQMETDLWFTFCSQRDLDQDHSASFHLLVIWDDEPTRKCVES